MKGLRSFIVASILSLILVFTSAIPVYASTRRIATVGPTGGSYTYTCDGTDDNVQFQQANDWVDDYGGEVDIYPMGYSFSSAVLPSSNVDWHFFESTITATAVYPLFNIKGKTNINISGSSTWECANTSAGGIIIGSDDNNNYSSHISINTNTFTVQNATFKAISIYNSTWVSLSGINIYGLLSPSTSELNYGLKFTGTVSHAYMNNVSEYGTGNGNYVSGGGGGEPNPILADFSYTQCSWVGDGSNTGMGFIFGYCNDLHIDNCLSADNYDYSHVAGNNLADGFQIMNSQNITLTNCESRNNIGACFSLGIDNTDNVSSCNIEYVNCIAIDSSCNPGFGMVVLPRASSTAIFDRVSYTNCQVFTNFSTAYNDNDQWGFAGAAFLAEGCKSATYTNCSQKIKSGSHGWYGLFIANTTYKGLTLEQTQAENVTAIGCTFQGNEGADIYDGGKNSRLFHNVVNNPKNEITASGGYNINLTSSGNTNVTLPTTGTLATLAGIEILNNKIIENTASPLQLQPSISQDIYAFGGTVGSDRTLRLLGTDADATNTKRDAPVIGLRAFYWNGATSTELPAGILNHVVSSTTPENILEFLVGSGSPSVLTLRNKNGVITVEPQGDLKIDSYKIWAGDLRFAADNSAIISNGNNVNLLFEGRNGSSTLTEAARLCGGTGSSSAYFQFTTPPKFSTSTTGTGSAALGSNCPATTASAPNTWITVTTSDGTAYVPAWK